MSDTPVGPYSRDFTAQFRERILSPRAWYDSAEALLESASRLEDDVQAFWSNPDRPTRSRWKPLGDDLVAVYLMLSAFAIENLFKGALVGRERLEVEEALNASPGKLPAILNDHDLYRLACRAGFETLAVRHEILLHRLSRSSVWYGRYPVPTSPALLDSGRDSPNLAPNRAGLWGYVRQDLNSIRAIVAETRAAQGDP